MTTELDDRDVQLLRAARSDPEAFALFYRRHVAEVVGFFAVRTRNPEVAADLAAETFAAALAAVPRYRHRRGVPPRAWLFGIARHKLVDSQRRGQVEDRARRRLGMEPIALEDQDLIRITEHSAEATTAIAALPADQRDAVRAHVLQQRGYDEIAADLQCSPSVIRQRVSRGLRAARKSIEGTS